MDEPPSSCRECHRVQDAAAAAFENLGAEACGRGGRKGRLSPQVPRFVCKERGEGRGENSTRCTPLIQASPASPSGACASLIRQLLGEKLRMNLPKRRGQVAPQSSLVPAWALAHGLTPCAKRKRPRS